MEMAPTCSSTRSTRRSTWCGLPRRGITTIAAWTGPSTPCSSSATTPRPVTTPASAPTPSATASTPTCASRSDGRGGRDLRDPRRRRRVPTALIAGDDVVCAEMAKAVPGIETAVVKEAMSRTGGHHPAGARPADHPRRGPAGHRARGLRRPCAARVRRPSPWRSSSARRSPMTRSARSRHDELSVVGDRTVAFTCGRMASGLRVGGQRADPRRRQAGARWVNARLPRLA